MKPITHCFRVTVFIQPPSPALTLLGQAELGSLLKKVSHG